MFGMTMMTTMQRHALLLALFHFVLLLTNQSCMVSLSSGAKTDDELCHNMMDWLCANDTVISNKVEVRNIVPGNPTPTPGMFALEALEKGELICCIPCDLIIKPVKEPKNGKWDCSTVNAIVKAIGNVSLNPYGNNLLEQFRDICLHFGL